MTSITFKEVYYTPKEGVKMKRFFILLCTLGLVLFAMNCSKPGAQDTKKDKKEQSADKEGKKKNADSKHKKKDGKEDKKTEAVPVQVVAPKVGDISSFLLFSSNVDSEKVVHVFPMTYGIITGINLDEGQHVKKNGVLAVLDDREATIAERKADINYKNLKAEFERKKEIYERKMLSREVFERLKFNMQTAKLEWDQKKLMLSYTRITSPIAGVVTRRYIKTGNKINTSQMAFTVVQDKEKIAVVNIPEQELHALFIKQKAEIYSGKMKTFGKVKRISPAIDPDSGTFKVTVDVNDTEGIFAVGQFVNVKVIKKVHNNVILLTKDAIVYEGGRMFVFVVNKDNEAIKKPVHLGFEEGNRVEIVKGLEKGDQVVTAGKSSLKNKTLVKVVEPIVG